MAKNFNPADAHRKQQRQKELKKNKEDRKKTREVATVKKDTTGKSLPLRLRAGDAAGRQLTSVVFGAAIESEIRKLTSRHGLNAADQSHLTELKAELAKIMKAKNDCKQAHSLLSWVCC